MAVRIRLLCVATLLLACGSASAGGVYQWKDAKGVTHFSDAPPPQGQYKSRDISQRDGQVAGTAAASTPVTSPNCALAKTNLDRLKTGGDIGLDANGDGKPDAPLSDAERTKQTQLAEANIKTFCSPPATAPHTQP